MIISMRKCRLTAALVVPVVLVAALRGQGDVFTPKKRDHWAWKKPVRAAVPPVSDAAWCKNPIDAFILAKLQGAGLRPAEPAPREQLLRRVTFDLIGLPPT